MILQHTTYHSPTQFVEALDKEELNTGQMRMALQEWSATDYEDGDMHVLEMRRSVQAH